ncbi:hypothetical protein [Hydrogenophaga sp. PML113]|uniref:hypothetical protein n=1 Tax=Hydrogenophaga sp. PML113 TaxID=1899350 RepID=UPI0011130F66
MSVILLVVDGLHELQTGTAGGGQVNDSPVAAMTVLEELEESARLSRLCPDAVPLDDEALEQLRRAFGARW